MDPNDYNTRYTLTPERTKLDELGMMLNDIVMNPEAGPLNSARIKSLNMEVYAMARKTAGVTSHDLADETQENSPRVLHYWTLTSLYWSQIYMSAANNLAVYQGWNR